MSLFLKVHYFRTSCLCSIAAWAGSSKGKHRFLTLLELCGEGRFIPRFVCTWLSFQNQWRQCPKLTLFPFMFYIGNDRGAEECSRAACQSCQSCASTASSTNTQALQENIEINGRNLKCHEQHVAEASSRLCSVLQALLWYNLTEINSLCSCSGPLDVPFAG